jgi:serine/threonine-protein kinase HipA
MRSGQVFFKNELAGVLSQLDNGSFTFKYTPFWFNDTNKPSISLNLPKTSMDYQSPTLFPFFFNLIPEGVNKLLICKKKRIDLTDYFGLLLEVAGDDTIGAVKVVKMS